MLKKFLIGILTVILFLSVSSCLPKQKFGELLLCKSIDSKTYGPVDIKEEYDMDADKIYANIKVENVYSSDTWSFKWIRAGDGKVIAQKSGKYMTGKNNYVNGYFVNYLAADEGSFIANPGEYMVEFYHNDKKVASAQFKINKPDFRIIDASLCSGIDDDGKPINSKQKFFFDEDIYLSVKLNCLIKGNNLKTEWFTLENRIDESYINLDKDYFYPAYKVFQLENNNIPLGPHSVDLYENNSLYNSYNFEVAVDVTNLKFYESKSQKFCFNYPSFLKVSEEELEVGYTISLAPNRTDDYQLKLWILSGDYSIENGWDEFIGNIFLKSLADTYSMEIASKEKVKKNGFAGYLYEFKNKQNYWHLNVYYKENDKNIIMFSSFSDEEYKYEADVVFAIVFDSFNYCQN